MITNGAKAIAISSSYGDGANRTFDSPKANGSGYAEANDILIHVHHHDRRRHEA